MALPIHNSRLHFSALFAFVVILSGCGGSGPVLPEPIVETLDKPAPPPRIIHPVFHTVVTAESSSRPAIQVDVLDASESFLTTAELYLAVQSSRFPAETWVLLPINVGDFSGCRLRYVQLPFEVEPGDNVVFNLLDDDNLSDAEEKAILKGCRAAGYCISVAGQIYCPKASAIITPLSATSADILGTAILTDCTQHKFDNYGTAEYIVPKSMPSEPQQANKLSVLDGSNYARVALRIYAPPQELGAHPVNAYPRLNKNGHAVLV